MKAMILEKSGASLKLAQLPDPHPGPGQVLVRVGACGVCRTDLHVVDGDLEDAKRPIVPGHEIVGRVIELGTGVQQFELQQRVGIPWLGHTCGQCSFCLDGSENLCDDPAFTGYQIDGGFAELCLADARYCFPLTGESTDAQLAPLLCAGLIGYRSLGMTGAARHIGIYGFGAAAHIVTQVACSQQRKVYAFTRAGDPAAQAFALEMGATWAGDSTQVAPRELDAAIIFAPVGALVPLALKSLRKGGVLVCGGIHMSDIPQFPYASLWGERVIRSVANLTRQDAIEFLRLAPEVPVVTRVVEYPLEQANQALQDLRDGRLSGAAVLIP